jgi:guanine deaminase
MAAQLFLGEIWHLTGKPALTGRDESYFETFKNGALAVDENGKILKVGNAKTLKDKFPDAEVTDYGNKVILPGFIDTHTHFPQMDMIGSYGEQLLSWLKNYTYPEEASFNDQLKSRRVARRFFYELFQNGTTTSCIYSSAFALTTTELFSAAKNTGARAIIGKVHMDKNVPEEFISSLDDDLNQTQALINEWHGHEGRLHYAITPRFAPVCSPALMSGLGELKKKNSEVYVQTHFAETEDEITWVLEQYPKAKNYAGIYHEFGLLGEKTILGHGLYPTEDELSMIADTDTKIAHCPTSNLFLGSGLFPYDQYLENRITVGLATDIGAGTSFNMWQTMNEAYKVQQLQKNPISPLRLLYLSTLGAAETLSMGDKVGSFETGKYADFQVINWENNRLLRERFHDRTAFDNLFACITLGDERIWHATWINGKNVIIRP